MGAIVDFRYQISTGHWKAQPRFCYDKESLENGAAIGEGITLYEAIDNLCNKVPLAVANDIRMHRLHGIYESPERDLGEIHKCLDMDGHRPTRDEWRKRHADYLFAKKLGRDYRSVDY